MPIPLSTAPALAEINLPNDTGMIAIVVAVLATGWIYMRAARKARRDPLAGPSPFASLSSQRRVENQMSDLLVELEKMVRQLNAQLDTRAAKLDELIRQADERLELLDARLREFDHLTAGDESPGLGTASPTPPPKPRRLGPPPPSDHIPGSYPAQSPATSAPAQYAPTHYADVSRAAGLTAGRIPRDAIRGTLQSTDFADALDATDGPPPPAPIPIDPRHAAVYRLADQGRNPLEISREIGQPAGEIELILALRRRAR